MRVIGGELKGRTYSGKIPKGVRPTSELVRESLFNTLNNLIEFDGINVLDLCAGTGALGFETISRGADYCCFVELNARVAALIKDISRHFDISAGKFKTVNLDVAKFLQNTNNICGGIKFDIIFFDPPYEAGIYELVLNQLATLEIFSTQSLIVVEHSTRTEIAIPENFDIIKQKKYGETAIAILTLAEN